MTARPIASSLPRLATEQVLIAVRPTDRGPELVYTDVDGELTAVAWTDQGYAEATVPDGYRLFAVQVSELLEQLPAQAGLVIDPQAPSPVAVPAARKADVVVMAAPFPPDVPVALGAPSEEPSTLLERLRPVLADLPAARRAWRLWSQADDAPGRLMIVVDTGRAEPDADEGQAVARRVAEVARGAALPYAVVGVPLAFVPGEARERVRAGEPFWSADDGSPS